MNNKYFVIGLVVLIVGYYIAFGGTPAGEVEGQRFNDYGTIETPEGLTDPDKMVVLSSDGTQESWVTIPRQPVMSFMGWQMVLILIGLVGLGSIQWRILSAIKDVPRETAMLYEIERAKDRET